MGAAEADRLLAAAPETAQFASTLRARADRLLEDLDAAANARDAALPVAPIAEDAAIQVWLPGGAGSRRLDRAAHERLWAETFEAADRYRFARLSTALSVVDGQVVVESRAAAFLHGDDHAQRPSLRERLVVDPNRRTGPIVNVVLHVSADTR